MTDALDLVRLRRDRCHETHERDNDEDDGRADSHRWLSGWGVATLTSNGRSFRKMLKTRLLVRGGS